MFREFNVKFEDVEMLGGTDNLLENTEVTKVVVRGDSKMSSLDSAFKNCRELDTVDGELDLNGVSDIDNLLENTELVKSISLKNVNNENISANNSFPHIEEINIGGELYNKKAMQNVIASKDWTFDNITYSGTVADNLQSKTIDVVDDNKATIKDALEQKVRGIEIIGQTYENLAKNKGEYELTGDFSKTWTESNNSIENPPSVIEIPEIWGNTIQDENDLNIIQSVGDLYVDESGEPILDEEGNEQYKLEISSDYKPISDFIIAENNIGNTNGWSISIKVKKKKGSPIIVKYKKNTSNSLRIGFKLGIDDTFRQFSIEPGDKVIGKLYTLIFDEQDVLDCEEFLLRTINHTVDSFKKVFINKEYEVFLSLNEDEQSNKTTILMPCKLMKVSDGIDRLFWDVSKNKYVIEKNVRKLVIDGTNRFIKERIRNGYSVYNIPTYENSKPNGSKFINDTFPTSTDFNNDTSEWMMSMWSSHLYLSISDSRGNVNEWFKNNPTVTYYHSTIPETIETKILEKPSLKTYSPKTYVSTNTEIQPSQMNIVNKKALINLKELQPNTGYTIQFKCNEKSDNPIKFNLCDTEKEVDMPIGVNHVSITTSNNLANNQLELSGAGNTVSEVMVIEGEMNQYPEYFDGVQSVGELQDDGTYKIEIATDNGVKNLVDTNPSSWKLLDGSVNIIQKTPIKVSPNTKYTAYWKSSSWLLVYKCDSEGNTISTYVHKNTGQFEFTTDDSTEYIIARIDHANSDLNYAHSCNLRIFEGEIDFGYEGYEKHRQYYNISVLTDKPLMKIEDIADRLFWNKSNNRYEIDRNGVIEVPTVIGDVIDLPRLYQRDDTNINISTGNIKPSKIKIEYLDID